MSTELLKQAVDYFGNQKRRLMRLVLHNQHYTTPYPLALCQRRWLCAFKKQLAENLKLLIYAQA